jgi:DeoR/GlpR family transcriptional regulator of sugar metabolism
MNRDQERKEHRARYVKLRIESVRNKTTEIKRLADELFISERTIKRDLKK